MDLLAANAAIFRDMIPKLLAVAPDAIFLIVSNPVDVISLGIGDPDLPTPQAVVDALIAGARDAATHQYPTNHGSEELV